MKEYEIKPFQWGTGRGDTDQLTGWIFEQERVNKSLNGSSAVRSADGNTLAVTYQFTDGKHLIVTQTRSDEGSRRTINCEDEMADTLKSLGIIPSESVNK